MQSNDDLAQALLQKVTEQMVDNLKETITATVQKEITKNLSKALLEGEFYRRINEDLQHGLKDIYKEITTARKGAGAPAAAQDPDQLFTEASDQLDAVLQTTEKAAVEIMDIVERLQEMQDVLGHIVRGFETGGVKREDRVKLGEINDTLGLELMRIMTHLGFQDLTGQRIKIIIQTIRKVEQIVLDLYMSTGIKIKTREAAPEKNLEEIEREAEHTMTELKGPQLESHQSSVDDLLSQLGLD